MLAIKNDSELKKQKKVLALHYFTNPNKKKFTLV